MKVGMRMRLQCVVKSMSKASARRGVDVSGRGLPGFEVRGMTER
jgi:hypothetical protein